MQIFDWIFAPSFEWSFFSVIVCVSARTGGVSGWGPQDGLLLAFNCIIVARHSLYTHAHTHVTSERVNGLIILLCSANLKRYYVLDLRRCWMGTKLVWL
jgi:hypothetical protein